MFSWNNVVIRTYTVFKITWDVRLAFILARAVFTVKNSFTLFWLKAAQERLPSIFIYDRSFSKMSPRSCKKLNYRENRVSRYLKRIVIAAWLHIRYWIVKAGRSLVCRYMSGFFWVFCSHVFRGVHCPSLVPFCWYENHPGFLVHLVQTWLACVGLETEKFISSRKVKSKQFFFWIFLVFSAQIFAIQLAKLSGKNSYD